MNQPLTLLQPDEYVAQVTDLINKAKKRVSFISMIVTDDTSTTKLIEAMAHAAERGVDVHVAVDMFTYTELSGQFIPSHYYSKRVRATTYMARRLSSAGVAFNWLGRPNITTMSGRTHSKWCVIDDTVFSFGGINLYEAAINNTDYMFTTTNKALADRITREQVRIVRADRGRHSYRSAKYTIDKHNTALIDGGFVGDSVIYRRACQLAEKATDILLVSQYCPTGKLNRILRRKEARLYFNPWQSATGVNRLIIRIGSLLSRQTTLYTRQRYLHCKFIIFTLPDGTKTAITGSHNFVYGGVMLGTREIALETTDPKVIGQLEAFFQDYIA